MKMVERGGRVDSNLCWCSAVMLEFSMRLIYSLHTSFHRIHYHIPDSPQCQELTPSHALHTPPVPAQPNGPLELRRSLWLACHMQYLVLPSPKLRVKCFNLGRVFHQSDLGGTSYAVVPLSCCGPKVW